MPIPYPQVLYDSNGLPVTVKTAAEAAQLPATCVATPTSAASLVAFPASTLAQLVPPAIHFTLPVALRNSITANASKKSRSHDEREN